MIAAIFVMMAAIVVALCLGVGINNAFPVAAIHVVPPLMLLFSMSYIRDIAVKPGDIYTKLINLWMAIFCGWMSFSASTALGRYYNEGIIPEAMAWADMPRIFGWAVAGVAFGLFLWFVISRLRMYKRSSYGPRHHNYR